MLLKILFYLAIAYVMLIALAFVFQRHLLYYPVNETLTQDRASSMNLRFWHGPDDGFRGFLGTPESQSPRGLVIVFHGNAGTAWNRVYYVRALCRLGYTVLLAEYPGYGGRKGKPSEESLVSDAIQTVKLAYSQFGKPIYLWGESLGCGVVAEVVERSSLPISGVVMLTPWDSLPRLAQTIYWYLPIRWLIRDKYDNVSNLSSFNGPVAVLIAEKDEIIPPRLGLNLYESLSDPKKLWMFENAGHNDWPSNPGQAWWKEVMEFLEGAFPKP